MTASVATLILMVCGGSAAAQTTTNLAAPVAPSGSHSPLRGEPLAPGKRTGLKPQSVPATSPWVPLKNQPPISAGTMLLGLDGSVLVHQDNTGTWYKLKPNAQGSYINGTWSAIASMPSGYAPEYFASQILSDGRMLIEGGEYNGSGTEVWTNKGAIYNPYTNTWTSVSAPSGWANIGDAQSVLLPSGQMMMANPFDSTNALLNASTLTWTTQSGTGKDDRNDEEGYQLLPTGNVLTIDDLSAPGSQVYTPSTGAWSSAGNLPSMFPDSGQELGPMILRPQGLVFGISAVGPTAVYHGGTHWTAGPSLPNNIDTHGQYDSADGPASILPNGNVLLAASPGEFQQPTHFWVYNGSTLTQVPDPAFAANDSSYYTRLLVLPTGQVLFDDGSDMEIYRQTGTPNSSWAPTISSLSSSTLTRGSTYTLSGTQLAGLSTGAAYGDDVQDSTNYPLVRITNTATGRVTYARTKNMTSHSVAPGTASSTQFTVASGTPTGASTLVVVANGIASAPQSVTIN